MGRPTRAQQALRHAELLDSALDIFLERGFDQATVEEIATAVGMSKRTVYARHADKAALFRAAVGRAIERYTVPRATLDAVVTEDLPETLMRIAHLRVANVATPVAIKLQRILITQSYRFPDLSGLAFEEGAGPTIRLLADLFARRTAAGEITVDEPERAATAFLSLAVGGLARMIVSGQMPGENEIGEQVRFAVALFLDGVRIR